MAREFYGYFDSIDADVREYDAAQFAHILRASVQNGVSSHEGGLEVTADGLDMRTHVACGGCVIEGYVYVLEDDGGHLQRLLQGHQQGRQRQQPHRHPHRALLPAHIYLYRLAAAH